MPKRFLPRMLLSLALVAMVWVEASAGSRLETSWSINGIGICAGPGQQGRTGAVGDGAGGMILTWRDARTTTNNDVYALRITASGDVAPGWPGCGVRVCSAAGNQDDGGVVTDGRGGAIVYWNDSRSSPTRVYAQRVSADGAILWDPEGVSVCVADSEQLAGPAVPDGRGGVVLVWFDRRRAPAPLPPHYHTRYDLFSQRIDGSGARLWAAEGVPVCADSGDRDLANGKAVATDGIGGMILLFTDEISGACFAQHLDGAGTRQWSPDGTPVPDVRGGELMSDGSGGAFIAWHDPRNGNDDVWLHHVDSNGQLLSPVGGIAVCTAVFDQRPESRGPCLAPDGAGGVFVTWHDERNGQDWDVYAQRILASGAVAPDWPVNGVPVCIAPGFQIYPAIVPDAVGGAIITWYDARSASTDYDVYAQRITASGAIAPGWPTNGVALCLVAGNQVDPIPIMDGGGGMIAYWDDYRGVDVDIYAQHVAANGAIGGATAVGLPGVPGLSLDAPRPNPTSGGLVISFSLPSPEPARIVVLDIAGRKVVTRDFAVVAPGRYSVHLTQAGTLASGVYEVLLLQGSRSLSRRIAVVR